uniref:Leucine-rich repeat-containing N-terminal plant-type domain-containing protein n=1 Tax=Nelumbo nucifera TaxID=4432 RepID=A0A822XRK4_NELNU|nr:TPA_asm: hypothetical protein HUJ06_024523 [Nelumbo nucifera]
MRCAWCWCEKTMVVEVSLLYYYFSCLLLLCYLQFGGCQAQAQAQEGYHYCVEKERVALLQLRDSAFNHHPDASSKMYNWGDNGDDCCRWKGVECDLSSSPFTVVGISILGERGSEGLGIWYPNATIL